MIQYGDTLVVEHLRDHKLRYKSPCGIAACMQNSVMMMPAFQAKSQVTVFLIKLHSQGD